MFALGCPTMQAQGTSRVIRYPDISGAENEPLIRDVLKQALAYVATKAKGSSTRFIDGNYILVLLSEKDRWLDCVQCADDAYALMILLQRFAVVSDMITNPPDPTAPLTLEIDYFRQVGAPRVATLLNGWLKPVVPFSDACASLTIDVLRRSVFGDAWCDLVLTDDIPDFFGDDLILSERPPFMPGILPDQLEQPNAQLPTLDI
jgi:hypothetical protein